VGEASGTQTEGRGLGEDVRTIDSWLKKEGDAWPLMRLTHRWK
jgi:hypothetical protein